MNKLFLTMLAVFTFAVGALAAPYSGYTANDLVGSNLSSRTFSNIIGARPVDASQCRQIPNTTYRFQEGLLFITSGKLRDVIQNYKSAPYDKYDFVTINKTSSATMTFNANDTYIGWLRTTLTPEDVLFITMHSHKPVEISIRNVSVYSNTRHNEVDNITSEDLGCYEIIGTNSANLLSRYMWLMSHKGAMAKDAYFRMETKHAVNSSFTNFTTYVKEFIIKGEPWVADWNMIKAEYNINF